MVVNILNKVIVWSAQYPDLNPLDYLWTRLAKCETLPNRILKIWQRFQVEWKMIPASF